MKCRAQPQYLDENHEITFAFFGFSKTYSKCLILLPAFYLIMWLMKSPKSSEKIAILEIWQLVSFLGVKTYFGILTPIDAFSGMEKIKYQELSSNSYCSH